MENAENHKTFYLSGLIVLGLFIIVCIFLQTSPDRLIGAAFCHQMSNRSPEYNFPFCWRCSGLFSGIFFGWIADIFGKKSKKLISQAEIVLFFVSAGFFLIDILNSSKFPGFSLYPESVKMRMISAYPLGFMMMQIIYRIFSRWTNGAIVSKPFGVWFTPIIMINGWILTDIIIFSHNYALSLIFRNLLAFSALAFLITLYTIIILCIIELKNQTYALPSVLTLGCMIAMVHIMLFGGIHIRFIHFEQIFI